MADFQYYQIKERKEFTTLECWVFLETMMMKWVISIYKWSFRFRFLLIHWYWVMKFLKQGFCDFMQEMILMMENVRSQPQVILQRLQFCYFYFYSVLVEEVNWENVCFVIREVTVSKIFKGYWWRWWTVMKDPSLISNAELLKPLIKELVSPTCN